MLHIKETARAQGFRDDPARAAPGDPASCARANPSLRAAGERMAINMPIQGTAADIIKIAMIRLAARLRGEGFRARLLLQVHDELLLEVPRDEVDRLVPLLRETMEGALALDVPLTVDVKVGDDWESMTPVPRGAVAAEAAEPRGPRCPSCPRSRPSRATCARISWAPRSPARAVHWPRTIASHPTRRGVRRRRRRAGASRRSAGGPSSSWSSSRATPR